MADLLYHAFAFLALFSYSLYHLISATHAHIAPPSTSSALVAVAADHAARPYYPLALPHSSPTATPSPALAASVALQGLWSFQTGLSLYVEAFIPEGCHRLLGLRDLSSTRCDIESSRLRAAALLDLFFTLHATLIAIVTSIVYATMTRAYGGNGLVRRHNGGSYDALLTSLSAGSLSDMGHIHMKALSNSSPQA